MRVAFKTDVGRKRAHNEDSILVDESMNIFLLADGMGGRQAGEVASNLAVKECYAWLKKNYDRTKREKDISNLLVESLLKAHDAVKAKSMTDINLMGMGTTLTEMVIKKFGAYICHIGDSRAYILSDEIKQITKDHTTEMYFIKDAIVVKGNPPLQKIRVLTQAVGAQETIIPEVKQVELKPADILLLCSDGLTDMLSDKEIESIVLEYRDNLAVIVESLIQAANVKGGIDNISVILIEY
ncbi:MAG: protein phosphatase 2C domain-containing protein [Candidatus Brocadia sp.]|nr:protein phosphatase 2C domain-containing protein [Candidatus Brocadia sp.]